MKTYNFRPSTSFFHISLAALLALTLGACSGDDTGAEDGGESATDSGSGPGSESSPGSDSATSGAASGSDSISGGETGGWDTHGGTSGGDPSGGEPTDTATPEPEPEPEPEPVCDDETPVVLFLSPDDSNSMSSPVQVREAVLSQWASLGGVPIRPWEFFNYYSFDYPAAPVGSVIVTPELLQLEGAAEGEYVLQIGVSSQAMSDAQRPAMNITLVLDESGSMSGAPMEMQKESCRALAASLKEGDVVSMVGWDTSNAVKLAGYQVSGPNDPMVLEKIEALAAGGGTDLNGGLKAGYELAKKSFDPARINRVVLISDGGANAGVTDIDLIAGSAGSEDQDGIYLVGVGVGSSGYNDALMDAVTDAGKGASVFIPSKAEAWKIFNKDFVNTMAVAARDVQVRLELPPGFEIVTFSGEEYSANPEEIEPQHLAPNDSMVFHQTIATCAPGLIEDKTMIVVAARFKDAITFEESEVVAEVLFADLLAAPSPEIRKGKALFAYTEALKAARDNDAAAAAKKAEALDFVEAALKALPGDVDLLEVQTILGKI